jgi:hypothetical protein
MSDYTRGSKSYGTTIYPVHANGTSGLLRRVEPLLTPKQFKSRHLKGILELAKRFGIEYSDDELKDRINLSVNQAELEIGTNIFAEQMKEKAPMDLNLYRQFVHIRADQGPIISLEKLAIVSANNQNLFVIPPEWVEPANFHQSQINVIPILGLYGSTAGGNDAAVASGGVFLTVIRTMQWVPAYWEIEYTVGVCKDAGAVPVVVNELIGVIGAMEILSGVAPSNTYNSVSLSQDGISQGSSGSGVQIFQARMAELQTKKATLVGQLKRIFGRKYFLTNI